MSDRNLERQEINLVDLLLYCAKHIGIMIIVGIIIACFAFVIKISQPSQSVSEDVSVRILDTESLLPGEDQSAYEIRMMNVNSVYSIVSSISALDNQIMIQNQYINDSLLMSIDPNNTVHSIAQIIIVSDSDVDGAVYSIRDLYMNSILNGEYLNNIANELNCQPEYVSELIRVNDIIKTGDDDSVLINIVGDNDSICSFDIEVIGSSSDITDMIMDSIIDYLDVCHDNYVENRVLVHSIDVVGRQSTVSYDQELFEQQNDTLGSLHDCIYRRDLEKTILDKYAKLLGITDSSILWSIPNVSDGSNVNETKGSVSEALLYSVIGLLIGCILVFLIVSINYVFGGTIVSQNQFFCLFDKVTRIGVCKPNSKRTPVRKYFDIISDDDSALSSKLSEKIIKANFKNLSSGFNRVLITGTVDDENSQSIIDLFDEKCDKRLNILNNPSILDDLNDYDGVVLIEKRGYTKKKNVDKEIELLSNSGVAIIGAILL